MALTWPHWKSNGRRCLLCLVSFTMRLRLKAFFDLDQINSITINNSTPPPCWRGRVRQISKWDKFLMLRDIDLIFCMNLYYVHKLCSLIMFINQTMQTSPTSQNSITWDNFCKNCPIWLKFGIHVSLTPQYRPEKVFWLALHIRTSSYWPHFLAHFSPPKKTFSGRFEVFLDWLVHTHGTESKWRHI